MKELIKLLYFIFSKKEVFYTTSILGLIAFGDIKKYYFLKNNVDFHFGYSKEEGKFAVLYDLGSKIK